VSDDWDQLPLFGPRRGLARHDGPDTMQAAADSQTEISGHYRRLVFQTITRAGSEGHTDDELEVLLCLRHQSVSARRRELVVAEKLEDSGRRRTTRSGRTAIVWIVKGEPCEGL